MKRHYLSKSKIMAGRQCEKRLWLEVHRPHLIEYGSDVEQRFAAGDDVNDIARAQYPDGVLVSYDHGANAAVEHTQRLLAEQPGTPIFEATFKAHDVLVRVDILKSSHEGYELIEVKSSTSVKDHHRVDSAVQTWVLESADIPVKAIYLCHIDNQFVYPGNGDYRGLFHYEDITKEARELSRAVPQWVAHYREALSANEPEIEMGPQCTDPYSCPFIAYCRGEESEYPLRHLPRISRQLIEALTSEGIEDIRDIPEGRLSSATQERVRRVTIAGEPELTPEAAEVGEYGYPRYYLDFETIQFAAPIWEGTGPYKPLPFQWSCHIELVSGELQHEEYLDTILQIITPETNTAERQRLTRELLAYCEHDTLAMVELVKYLSK